MDRIERQVLAEYGRPLPDAEAQGPAAAEVTARKPSLFKPPYRRRTLVMVVFHVFQTIGYYGFSNWLPTLLVSQGIPISRSLGYSAVLALIPPIAPLAFFWIADRCERKWLVAAGALLAASFGLVMARMTPQSNVVVFTAVGACVALGNSLMSLAYHTYQSELFPTSIRAWGIGFVYSFSRLSAVLSGYLVAFILAEVGSSGVFVMIAGAMIIVALTIGLFGPRTRGLALEEI